MFYNASNSLMSRIGREESIPAETFPIIDQAIDQAYTTCIFKALQLIVRSESAEEPSFPGNQSHDLTLNF